MFTTDLIYAAVALAIAWREIVFKIFAERQLEINALEPQFGTWEYRNFVLTTRYGATYVLSFPALLSLETTTALTLMALSTISWEIIWQGAKTSDRMYRNALIHNFWG